MEGLLLVNKPSGWTSFDVVNYVRKVVSNSEGMPARQLKVGHCGTLDPLATGLLIILVGKNYTRHASRLTKMKKDYKVEFKLGVTSPSADTETQIQFVSSTKPSRVQLKKACQQFRGEIEQIPPVYSAIKVKGQRAYALARKGQTVILEARKVTIYNLELTRYNYPLVGLNVEVSSGTYIRSLVHDIGTTLGTGAVMTELVRTKIGKYSLADALDSDNLTPKIIKQKLIHTKEVGL